MHAATFTAIALHLIRCGDPELRRRSCHCNIFLESTERTAFVLVPTHRILLRTSLHLADPKPSNELSHAAEATMSGPASDAEARVMFLHMMPPDQQMTNAKAAEIAGTLGRSVSNVK
jgi:hypothetical protein